MTTNTAELKIQKKTRIEKAAAKRAVILAVAADLITQKGYEGTSLKDICEKASCSKSAIYEYFENKEGLLAALTEDIAVDLSQTLHAFHMQHLSVEESLLRYARLALKLILDDRHGDCSRDYFCCLETSGAGTNLLPGWCPYCTTRTNTIF
jgi:AcrR family transcriptional regulator